MSGVFYERGSGNVGEARGGVVELVEGEGKGETAGVVEFLGKDFYFEFFMRRITSFMARYGKVTERVVISLPSTISAAPMA